MSLQIWWPLTGNTDNYGLYGALPKPSSTNASVSPDGKIGECYEFSDSGRTYIRWSTNATIRNIFINHSFSTCAWVKSTVNAGRCWLSVTYAYRFYSTIAYVPGGNGLTDSTSAAIDGKWHHVCYTHDHDTLENNFYIDGVKVKSGVGTSGATTTYTNAMDIGHDVNSSQSDSFYFRGNINDVRIYDHALSPKEVKEISKALLLHYKLDDEYIEKTTNLGGTSVNYSNMTYGTAYAAGGWGGDKGTVTYYPSGGYNNYPYKIYHKTSGGTGGICKKTANDITIQSGKTYTMSIYVKSDRNYTDSTYSFNINGSSVTSNNHYITPPTAVKFTTEWQRIVHTFTATSAQTGKYGEMSIIYNDAVDDYYVYYSGFQIEENDHATPYVNGTSTPVCIDCSGYRNDGIPTGAIMSNSGTPRYLASTKFSNSSCAIGIGDLSLLVPEKIFTFNIWFKKVTGEWSTKSWETILGGPSGFELEGKLSSTQNAFVHPYSWGGGSTTSGNSYSIAYDLDVWNMITMVRTTSNTKFYLNGELKVTGTAGSIPVGDYFIGAWKTATAQNYRGYFSDARIYATALSAEDVMELYNTEASIDNKGNIFTYQLIEK